MEIVLAGSIAFDYLMRFPGRFKDMLIEQSLDKISLSFLVDDMDKHFGGVSANIAYTMGLLGAKPALFGTVGKDFEAYRTHLKNVGVDTSTVIVLDDVFTGSFFANTDLDNNQIASFYAGAMGRAGEFPLMETFTKKPDLVVISPNDPNAMTEQVDACRANDIPFMYDPSQQVARMDGDALLPGIEGCQYLACNEYEWEVIQKKTGYTVDKLQGQGSIFLHTLGADGCNIYHNGEVTHIPAAPPEVIVDPTGAGDAFRAGFLTGLNYGLPLEIAGRMGTLCGTYALETVGTQNHHFTADTFIKRYRAHHDDQGALNVITT